MSTISESLITSIIQNVAKSCGVNNSQYSLGVFDNMGQNYFGILIPVLITNLDGKKIHIVIKLAPTEQRYRVSGAVTKFFAREIYVYSVVLAKYQEIQESLVLMSPYIIPKCYYVSNEYCKEVIVLENMCNKNYKPHDMGMFLDLDHIYISVTSLAKFHALSFILKEKEPSLYIQITKTCTPLTVTTNERFMNILLDRLKQAIKKFQSSRYEMLLQKFKHNYVKFIEATVTSVKTTCICHGDIWKENILFKYENKKPTSACLIDYQTTRVCSPAFDMLYLIASSTNSELRKIHFNQLVNVYYQTFCQTLGEAGFDSKELYSRETFEKDLQIVAPACFIIVNTALWLSHGLQEEGPVRSKHVWSTNEEKMSAVEKYRIAIRNIIDDFVNYGYLHLD